MRLDRLNDNLLHVSLGRFLTVQELRQGEIFSVFDYRVGAVSKLLVELERGKETVFGENLF